MRIDIQSNKMLQSNDSPSQDQEGQSLHGIGYSEDEENRNHQSQGTRNMIDEIQRFVRENQQMDSNLYPVQP